ncbi:MAG: T9SS type A sorting domain-containing protein, partial [Cyclobacteriaceae bacterium]
QLSFTFEGWIKSLSTSYTSGSRNGLPHKDYEHYFNANGWVADVTSTTLLTTNATRQAYLRGELQLWSPNGTGGGTSGYVFTSVGVKNIRADVTDGHHNSDWCMTELKVICNGVGCPAGSGSNIEGTVKTAQDQAVSNVAVSIDANITEFPKTVNTNETGGYEIKVANGLDYQVTASKGGDYLNGVSTLDLVMIQRHILGFESLTSPYKLIAADANNDGKVTASDLTELRKLILGVTSELPKNTSWRFAVKGQSINASNPFPFVEKISIENLSIDKTGQDFVAVKIGDVSGNVSTNVSNPNLESRIAEKVAMAVTEGTIAAGETVAIPVTAARFDEVYGYQFTMKLNGASYVGVQAGAIDVNANNVGVIANNVITMSFASMESVSVKEHEVLFTIIVKANKAGKVSEVLGLNSSVTKTEAYVGAEMHVGQLSLGVRTITETEEGIELFQNEPNPFIGRTTISYIMPADAPVVITVYDINGKVIAVRKADAIKGLNSEVFTTAQLGVSGVLYYKLESGDYSAYKKMILVE